MSRVLITGSVQGLGVLAGRQLIAADDEVVGDLASIEQTRQVAEQANASGRFDAVIHNAGVFVEPQRVETVDGLAQVFAVNVLAPYLLTALIDRPGRLVFLSSSRHPEANSTSTTSSGPAGAGTPHGPTPNPSCWT
jgi:NAD(P)-dependent dehydrogenase (short-subunit alcohol dehydrogenase family)